MIILLALDDIGHRAACDRLHRRCEAWWSAVVRPKLTEGQARQAHIDALETQLVALGVVPAAVDDVAASGIDEVDGFAPDFGTDPFFPNGDQTVDRQPPQDEPSEGPSYWI